MMLFMMLLVFIVEWLFKLGEYWQFDYWLEVVFCWIKYFLLLGMLLMMLVVVVVVYIIQCLLQGQLFNILLLVFWILLGLLCIGVGKVWLYYYVYLKVVLCNDSCVCDVMVSELMLIYGVLLGCDECEYFSEL